MSTILPEDVDKCEVVLSRAIDVRTACMQYLAAYIRHDSTPLGTAGNLPSSIVIDPGKIIKTTFTGDGPIADAISQLKSSVDSYNNSLSNIHLRIGIKTYELVKGMYLHMF